MSIFVSTAATLGFAGGAAFYANKLLRAADGGGFEQDWLADELDFDHLLEDRTTVALKDGTLFRVFRLKGVSYDTMNMAEQEALFKQRSNILHQLGGSGSAFRLIAVKQLKDISFDSEWPSPALREIGKAEQDLFKRAYTMDWYVVLEATTFETLNKHTKTLLSGFDRYQIEVVEGAEDLKAHCELTAFLTYLVCGHMPENVKRVSRSINANLPACDLIINKDGTILTQTPRKHIHRTIGVSEYPDSVSGMMISKILALPAELEVTQICIPLNTEKTILEYTRKKAEQLNGFLTSVSMVDQLEAATEELTNNSNTLYQTQLQFTVRAKSEEELNTVLDQISAILNTRRVRHSVETAPAANCWFNRLPGRNKLVRKLRLFDSNIAALWPFQYSPEGLYSSPFGNRPLRLFKTPTGQNYALQFHVFDKKDVAGHYLLFAPTGGGKSTFIMHLLGGIAKFPGVPNYIFDSMHGAQYMIEVMGGRYQSFDTLSLNPLDCDLSDTNARQRANRMMRVMLGEQYTQDMSDQINDVLDMASVLDVGERTFSNIYKTAFPVDTQIKQSFQQWVSSERQGAGAYSHIFNAPRDSIRSFLDQSYLTGIDMTEPLKDPLLGPALVTHISSAIFEAAHANRNGFSIFIDEAANLLKNKGFRDLASQMYKEYRKLGGVVGMAFQSPSDLVIHGKEADGIISNAPTLFFMFGCGGSDADLEPFNLSEDQIAFIRGETDLAGGRQVLVVKRDKASSYNESTIIDVDLTPYGDALRFYRSGPDPVAELRKIQEVWGDQWLSHV
ncbi:VirB4 family type IV secretion system protein [Pseudovibrio sp. Tun.PSC04-5.I4]|uniref:VirB4 family type IV secretion/conjugal transfer ATPase n=1 Tax=Pseudovibrio sp. Tun.PSC04-5.I4 TaxID=1798213 RepID=UPI00088D2BCA|nr:VirB4 family type IV secretion system protein [Pseudovibrio sp. Tun.PSC04-5.I4]SDR45161.1 type IV secretion system protein VirB4 [Pseudovibrio sp. Tun.PSC04-5.I4]